MFGNNGREFGISLPKQPKCKVNRCRFHFLKMDCHCHNSFLLFCRLLVPSERTVASFRRHVAFRFYPLEGLTSLPVTMPTTSKKLIGQGQRGREDVSLPPFPSVLVML